MILHQALLIAKCFLFCLLVLASTYGFGGLFLPLRGYSSLERLFFRCCLGIVVWSYSVFFLALCSALYTPSLLVLLIVSLWKAGGLIKEEPCTSQKLDQSEFMFAIALTVGSVPTFLIALYPAHTWDDIAYHLPSAALYIKHHSLIVTEYLRFPVFNEFAELLFAAAFPFLKDIGAQLICWVSNVLVLVGIFAFFRGRGRTRAGLIGVAVWLASDLALKLSTIAFVEIPLALLCWASVYSLLEAVQRPRTNNLFVILSGIFAGCAMATKYTALPMAFGIFCGLLLNEFAKTSFFKNRCAAFFFCATSAAFSLPWFARNFIITGNPTFPYLSSVFGRHSSLYSNADYDSLAFFVSTVPALPITPLGFINGLLKLSFDPRFNSELSMRFDALFVPGTLAALVCLFYARSRMTISTCLVISLAFMVPWFITSQNTRYLVAILPVIAAYSGMSLSIGLDWLRDSIVRSVKTDISLESLLIGVVLVVAPLSFGINQVQEMGRLPSTNSEKAKFLSKVLPTYPAYQFLNELPLGTLYNFADEQMFFFYLDGISMGDFFGQESFSVLQQHASTGETLYAFLRSHGVNYLLVNLKRPRLNLRIPKDRFFEKHFDKIFESFNCEVYSIDRFPLRKGSK